MYILQETQNSKVGKRVTGWSWTQLGCRVIATTDCAQNPRGHWNPSWPPGTHSEFWGDLFLADHHITYTKYGVCGVEHAAGQLQPASSDVCIYKLHIYIFVVFIVLNIIIFTVESTYFATTGLLLSCCSRIIWECGAGLSDV